MSSTVAVTAQIAHGPHRRRSLAQLRRGHRKAAEQRPGRAPAGRDRGHRACRQLDSLSARGSRGGHMSGPAFAGLILALNQPQARAHLGRTRLIIDLAQRGWPRAPVKDPGTQNQMICIIPLARPAQLQVVHTRSGAFLTRDAYEGGDLACPSVRSYVEVNVCCWGLGWPSLPGLSLTGRCPRTATVTSSAAPFLAGCTGLTREAYALDLRQFAGWRQLHNVRLFEARRADIVLRS